MSNVLILNAHHPYSFAPGNLNGALANMAQELLESRGHDVRLVNTQDVADTELSSDEAIANFRWADTVILQSPTYWMGVPWSFKKYMDDLLTDGTDGRLCEGDGRSSDAPKENYGAGGTLTGKKYMLSLTFNAPEEAFNNPKEFLFQGKSVDDLWFPMHMNFRFFGMEAIDTFVCYDVMKNPQIEADLVRFQQHLEAHF